MNQSTGIKPIVAAVVAAASLTASAAEHTVPRGMHILPQASGCNIGTFPQTMKAGQYNELCNIMQDSEKCLAAIKRQFRQNGEVVTVKAVNSDDAARMSYCLDVLRSELIHSGEEAE